MENAFQCAKQEAQPPTQRHFYSLFTYFKQLLCKKIKPWVDTLNDRQHNYFEVTAVSECYGPRHIIVVLGTD